MLAVAPQPKILEHHPRVRNRLPLEEPLAVDRHRRRSGEIDQFGGEPDLHAVGSTPHGERVGGPGLRLNLERPHAGRRWPLFRKHDCLRREPFEFDPPEEPVPWPHRHHLELLREKAAPLAAHPVEQPQQFVREVLVAAAAILDIGGVEALGEVAVEIGGVALHGGPVEFSSDCVDRQRSGVGPVVGDVAARRGADHHEARPEIGVRKRDIPGGVAAQRVAGEKHAIGVDRKPPDRLPKRCQYGVVLAGRVAVGRLVVLAPGRRNHHIAVPRRLTEPGPIGGRHAGPPLDLVERRRPGGVERDDRRISPQGIVFGR